MNTGKIFKIDGMELHVTCNEHAMYTLMFTDRMKTIEVDSESLNKMFNEHANDIEFDIEVHNRKRIQLEIHDSKFCKLAISSMDDHSDQFCVGLFRIQLDDLFKAGIEHASTYGFVSSCNNIDNKDSTQKIKLHETDYIVLSAVESDDSTLLNYEFYMKFHDRHVVVSQKEFQEIRQRCNANLDVTIRFDNDEDDYINFESHTDYLVNIKKCGASKIQTVPVNKNDLHELLNAGFKHASMHGHGSGNKFGKIALIGMGLIGSSIYRALEVSGMCDEVVGYDINHNMSGMNMMDTMEEAVKNAEIVILCVPVGAMGIAMMEISPFLGYGTILTDVGSVKKSVVDAIVPYLPKGVDFVPAHPLAGTENSGPLAGFATLFEDKACIVMEGHASEESIEKIESMWMEIGAIPKRMNANDHDATLSFTSHLPHLIAYAMMNIVMKRNVADYASSGFDDFTRIAASDPVMWRDVFLNNKENVSEAINNFIQELLSLSNAINSGNGDALIEYFQKVSDAKREGNSDGFDRNLHHEMHLHGK